MIFDTSSRIDREIKMNEHKETSWTIGTRTLPAPAGASDVLRNSIMNTPVPDAAPRLLLPKDEAEWIALIAKLEGEKTAMVPVIAERLSVSIEHTEIEGVKVQSVTPAKVDPSHEDHLFVNVHGGAYILNQGDAGLPEAMLIASRAKIRVLSIDYRMPPEHPFPAGLDDVVVVYQHLLGQRPARSMALGGTRDLFLSNTARTHAKLRAAGVIADMLVFEGVSHGDYAFEAESPESQLAYAELNAFLQQHLQ
jgi:acetyl esterase/lipase